jgi:hypothetical protein
MGNRKRVHLVVIMACLENKLIRAVETPNATSEAAHGKAIVITPDIPVTSHTQTELVYTVLSVHETDMKSNKQ